MVTNLSSLPKIVEKQKKRLGRGLGTGKGSKSGRGTTRHQTAREKIPLAFEGGQGRLIKRFPLLRGKNRNNSVRPSNMVVSLDALNVFEDNAIVNIQALKEKKIIVGKGKLIYVKVLNNGELKKKLIVELPVSKSVQKTIESLGGQVKKA